MSVLAQRCLGETAHPTRRARPSDQGTPRAQRHDARRPRRSGRRLPHLHVAHRDRSRKSNLQRSARTGESSWRGHRRAAGSANDGSAGTCEVGARYIAGTGRQVVTGRTLISIDASAVSHAPPVISRSNSWTGGRSSLGGGAPEGDWRIGLRTHRIDELMPWNIGRHFLDQGRQEQQQPASAMAA